MVKTIHKALCLAAFVSSLGLASHVNANLILSGQIVQNGLTSNFCSRDQFGSSSCPDGISVFAGDTNLALGTLQINYNLAPINGSFNIFTFVINANLLQPTPTLDITFSSSLVNATQDPLTVHLTISQTGFTPPISQTTETGSGTFQTGGVNSLPSTAALAWYVDPLNSQGGETLNDLPGNLLDSFSTSALATNSFSHSDLDSVAITNPFSMTLGLSFTIRPGVSVTDFSQRISGILAPTNGIVPEPASTLLLGLGLAGLGWSRRKK